MVTHHARINGVEYELEAPPEATPEEVAAAMILLVDETESTSPAIPHLDTPNAKSP